MIEPIAAQLIYGAVIIGLVAFITSLCGLLVVLPLISAGRPQLTIRITFVDVGCLMVMLGIVSIVVRSCFPEGDQVDAAIWGMSISSIVAWWWFVLAVWMSRLGVTASLDRAAYQLFVVPGAFVTPLLLLTGGNQALYTGFDILILVYPAAFAACLPATQWLIERVHRREAATVELSFGSRSTTETSHQAPVDPSELP